MLVTGRSVSVSLDPWEFPDYVVQGWETQQEAYHKDLLERSRVVMDGLAMFVGEEVDSCCSNRPEPEDGQKGLKFENC